VIEAPEEALGIAEQRLSSTEPRMEVSACRNAALHLVLGAPDLPAKPRFDVLR
jgi:hypothetical protein